MRHFFAHSYWHLLPEKAEPMERLDLYLYQKGYASSRTKAREMIEAGLVTIDGIPAKKASMKVEDDCRLTITGDLYPYVGKGGLKLEKALEEFSADPQGKVCMDVGASTGGFTDCMLRRGAVKVFAIDSGSEQLHESLRRDHRVISMEQTNIRYVTPQMLGEKVSLAAIDVSFISLTQVLYPVKQCLKNDGCIICLIKPQFEAGKGNVGKKGVVKDRKIHLSVIRKIMEYAASIGLDSRHLTYSPVRGQEGNIEYLAQFIPSDHPRIPGDDWIRDIISSAHKCT